MYHSILPTEMHDTGKSKVRRLISVQWLIFAKKSRVLPPRQVHSLGTVARESGLGQDGVIELMPFLGINAGG